MGYPDTFEGFLIEDHEKWSDFKKQEFTPKKFEDRDIDIKIDACGVCGSDVHTITGGWGGCPLPMCVGHEIIGKAVKVGSKVTTVEVGDRVGVGAAIYACLECKLCKAGQENYCPGKVDTYGERYKDGTVSHGGYASHVRAHEHFTFKIPDNIETNDAAPLMCAGLTVWSPMVRAKMGPGKKVAILGVGGLGHLGIRFAKALGADVYALSQSPGKEADARNMGAQEFILTSQKDWAKKWAYEFDMILNTADMTHTFNIQEYLSTLNVNGEFHHVGLPDEPLPQMMVQDFMPNGVKMGGSNIGNRTEMFSMLQVASEKGIKPVVETIRISEAGCKEAVERVKKNDVRYRFTLTGYDEAFGKRE